MTDVEKSFVLDLLLAGEGGLHRRDVQKFDKKNSGVVLNLEVRSLIQWESDKTGRPTFLVLTWKGEEVAQLLMQIAKHESRKAVRPV